MNAKQQQVQMAFRRAIRFVKDRPALTEGTSSESQPLGNAVQALDSVVQRLAMHATSQHTFGSASIIAARDEDTLRRNLTQQHLKSIAMIARGLRGAVPGIGILQMPSTSPGSSI